MITRSIDGPCFARQGRASPGIWAITSQPAVPPSRPGMTFAAHPDESPRRGPAFGEITAGMRRCSRATSPMSSAGSIRCRAIMTAASASGCRRAAPSWPMCRSPRSAKGPSGADDEVYGPEVPRANCPAYFVQNFHYQTGGYLTEESAPLYDTQVEVLFSGTANAMRRQCLPPIAAMACRPRPARVRLLDVACGTGRLSAFRKAGLSAPWRHGLDLSQPYLEEAGRHFGPLCRGLRDRQGRSACPFHRRASISSLRLSLP